MVSLSIATLFSRVLNEAHFLGPTGDSFGHLSCLKLNHAESGKHSPGSSASASSFVRGNLCFMVPVVSPA